MSEPEIQGGVCKVLFLMFGVIIIASIYKLFEGLIKDEFIDPLYIAISSIAAAIYLILCLAHTCNFLNKSEIIEDDVKTNNIIIEKI